MLPRVLTWIFLTTVLCYVTLVLLEDLAKRCQPQQESVLVKIVRMTKLLLGYPPPKPPWWEFVCPLIEEYGLDTIYRAYLFFALLQWAVVLLLCNRKKDPNRRHDRIKRWPSNLQNRKFGRRRRESLSGLKTSPAPPGICARTASRHPLALQYCTLPRTPVRPRAFVNSPRVEEIHHTSEPDDFTKTYRKLLVGPTDKCYEALKLVITGAFSALAVPVGDVAWAYDKDRFGHPTVMVAQSAVFRVRVSTGPLGLDIRVYHLGAVMGRRGNQTIRPFCVRVYALTYSGIKRVDEKRLVVTGDGWDVRPVH